MSTSDPHFETGTDWRRDRFLDDPAEMRRIATTLRLTPPEADSLLDVGCGNAVFLETLHRERPDMLIEGIEPSSAARAASAPGLPIRVGSIEALPYPDRSWDAVTCLEVLEHLPWGTCERGISELTRVARTTVLVSVPFRERRVPVRCPSCGCLFDPYRHLRTFTSASLADLLPGFSVTAEEHVDARDDWASAFARAVIPFRRRPWTAGPICPQCSYTTGPSKASQQPRSVDESRRLDVKRVIKGLFPRTKPYWVVVRYDRP